MSEDAAVPPASRSAAATSLAPSSEVVLKGEASRPLYRTDHQRRRASRSRCATTVRFCIVCHASALEARAAACLAHAHHMHDISMVYAWCRHGVGMVYAWSMHDMHGVCMVYGAYVQM